MGTVSGLRTRRYHGLLVVPGAGGRHVGLVSLDPALTVGRARRCGSPTHEWASGAVAPDRPPPPRVLRPRRRPAAVAVAHRRRGARAGTGDGARPVPRRRGAPAGVRARPGPALAHRAVHLARRPRQPPRRRRAGAGDDEGRRRRRRRRRVPARRPRLASARRVVVRLLRPRGGGPGLRPGRGPVVRRLVHRHAGAGRGRWRSRPGPATCGASRRRPPTWWRPRASGPARVVAAAKPDDDVDAALALAADAFMVKGPDVVAGYPWFGCWMRDALTAYEGLFLRTGRASEGAQLLRRYVAEAGRARPTAASDAPLWLVHAVDRHVAAHRRRPPRRRPGRPARRPARRLRLRRGAVRRPAGPDRRPARPRAPTGPRRPG